jgi:hypothetical protein
MINEARPIPPHHQIAALRAAAVTLEQHKRALAVVEAARMVWEVERLHEEAAIRGGKLMELGRCLAVFDAGEKPR